MSIAANSQQPNFVSEHLETFTSNTNGSSANLGAELVYTQDGIGRYLSFHWQHCQRFGIDPQQVVDANVDAVFAPVDKVAYLERLQRILTTLVPEKCQYWFRYQEQLIELELIISPILPTLGNPAIAVLVIGRLLQATISETEMEAIAKPATELELALRSQQHQQLVTQITRNIRRTLDLDVIWQQTVDSLGELLQLKRSIICPYQPSNNKLKVIAEYRQPAIKFCIGFRSGYCC